MNALTMSGPMVRRTLDGRKDMTRRLLGPRNCLIDGYPATAAELSTLDFSQAWVDPGPSPAGNAGPYLKVPRADGDSVHRVYPRLQPGDRLWVRERWRTEERAADGIAGIRFAADGAFAPIEKTRAAADRWMDAHDRGRYGDAWRNPLFMPRWASRIELELTGVSVQRLQDISDADICREGVADLTFDELLEMGATLRQLGKQMGSGWLTHPIEFWETRTYLEHWQIGWDALNGHRGAGWQANPWVWRIEFRRVT